MRVKNSALRWSLHAENWHAYIQFHTTVAVMYVKERGRDSKNGSGRPGRDSYLKTWVISSLTLRAGRGQ
jgi:hypothetical protein